ncbi:hypothetical protein B0H13DRAFT_2370542 [Mycena leptocephala]|nr:hypothetical protein B0H13DRAFT_2370542 [Mycena leptocephala]
MVDWFIPHFFPPQLSSAITLESLSVTVGPSVLGWPSPRDHAASWISQFLAHAPRLARLHWEGPDILAPWAQLTHLSWHIDLADPRHFEQTLDLLSNLIHLRLQLCIDRYRQFKTPTSLHILPNVTTYSFSGDTAVTRFLILPKLRHFILIWSHTTAPNDFDLFLERSQCAIQSLELWQHHFSRIPATLLNHPAIAPSLTRLLISSHDLNEFFCELDRSNPGMLPPRLALLRDVDRCFRIEKLPGIDEDETSGVLALIIHAQLPMLAQLELDDREISSVSTAPELESRIVHTGDSTAFSVSRQEKDENQVANAADADFNKRDTSFYVEASVYERLNHTLPTLRPS